MLLSYLQTRFSEETLPWLCAALREIPALWEALEASPPEALQSLPGEPGGWSPAGLALHALGYPSPAGQAQSPSEGLPSPWQERATQALEHHLGAQPPQNPPLPHAGLVALALCAELGRTCDWAFLPPMLSAIPLEHWHLPLAVLAGLLPSPAGLYRFLLEREAFHPLLWTTLLSQPAPPAEQEQTAQSLLQGISPLLLPAALTALHLRRPQLATRLSQKMRAALEQISQEHYRHTLLASLWHAMPLPTSTGKAPVEESRLAMHLLQHNAPEEAADLLSWHDEHPARLTARAALALARGENSQAHQLAHQALQALRAAPLPAPDLYQALGEIMMHLDFPQEATYLLERALRQRPATPSLLRLYANSLQRTDRAQQAVHAAQLACVLAPEDVENQRALAEAREHAGQWSQALETRHRILEKVPESPADHYALGLCALHAGNLALAQQAAEDALRRAPQHGLSHTLLGRIHEALGNTARAIEHYQQATHLAPREAQAWLALAALQRSLGDLPAALRTLHTAAQAAPQEAEIHWQLGACLLQAGRPDEALSPLQQAAHLCGLPVLDLEAEPPERLTINRPLSHLMAQSAAALGKTCAALHRHAFAALYLRIAYHHDPAACDTAHAYARTLLALNRYAEAISVLENLLATHPTQASPYVDYAFACLRQGTSLEAAQQALEAALQLEPQHAQAHTLLGELLAGQGNYPQALEHYQQAMHASPEWDSEWQVRVTLGFAYVTLELGQPENAIAALQALIQRLPQHASLQQALYEAYRKAGLLPEARQQLEILFTLYQDAADNLIWLAEEAARAEHTSLLKRILERLHQIPPESHQGLLRWGAFYAHSGEAQQAARIFARLIADPQTPPDILCRAGKSLLQAGHPAAAIPSLEAARQRSTPPSEDLLAVLSTAYQRSGQPEIALQVVTDALQDHPLSVRLLKQAARLHMAQAQTATALDYLEAILTHAPDDLEARHLLLETLQQRGELLSAYRHARWMVTYLDEHLPRTSTCQQAHRVAAALACELFDFQAARAFLENHHAEEPHPETLILRAELALHCDAEVEAVQALQAALAASPQEPRLLALQARLLYRQNAPEEARRLLTEALEAAPGFTPEQRRALGLAAIELQDLPTAIRLLTPLAEKPERSPWGALLYAQALILQAEQRALASALDMHVEAPSNQHAAAIHSTLGKLAHCFTSQDLPQPEALLHWEKRAAMLFSPQAESAPPSDDPDDVAAYLMFLRHTNQPEMAPKAARRAPHAPLVWLQLALTLEASTPQEAIQAAQRALQLAPSRSWRWYAATHYLIARLRLSTHALKEALASLEEALALHPREVIWRRKALQVAHACDLHPNAARHAEALASMQALSSDDALLLADAQRALGNPQAALETLTTLTSEHPQHADAWYRMAAIHATQQNWAECARCAERALEHGSTTALRLRVQAALGMGDGHAARLRAIQLTRQIPQDPEAWYLLAQAHRLRERPDLMLEAIQKALALRPEAPLDWHLLHIEALASAKDSQTALRIALPLVQRFPESEDLLHLAITLAQQSGALEQVLTLAQNALQSTASFSEALRAELHLAAGQVLHRRGQLDQAVYHLTQAVEHRPESPEIWLALGQAYETRREYHRAAQAYEQACALSPDDALPYERAGLCYKALKDYPRAERAIRHAVSLAQTDVRLQRLLASLTALNVVHHA